MRSLTKLSSSITRHPVFWTFFSLTAIAALLYLVYLPVRLHYVELETKNLPDVQYGDMVACLALLVSTLLAVFSIIPNLKSLAMASRFTHYSELDHMYNELLKLAIEHPELREPSTPKDRVKYETYAFMVWNFLETIHDRCVDDARLRGTWAPIVRAECDLHKEWFRAQTIPYDSIKSPKFCLAFCDFIWRTFYVTGDAGSIMPNRDDWINSSWAYRSDDEIREDDNLAEYVHTSGNRVPMIKWRRKYARALKRSVPSMPVSEALESPETKATPPAPGRS